MSISYDVFGDIEKSVIYLCNPNNKNQGILNGVIPSSVVYSDLSPKEFSTLEFKVERYIQDDNGNTVESNLYNNIHVLQEILLSGIGYFIITTEPIIEKDGLLNETKTVKAKSFEYSFINKDIKDVDINTGKEASIERLVNGNVDALGVTQNYVQFYNTTNTSLSLLHFVLTYVDGWSIGYVSNSLKTKQKQFTIDATNVYAFLMQEVSQAFECIFVFDIMNKTINAYDINEYGNDTGIIIGLRNLAKVIKVAPQTEQLYTRFTVNGGDDLGINLANYGSNQIEDLSYFLNTKYMKQELIDKYNTWKTAYEDNRATYINLVKSYSANQEARDEIINKVPVDALSLDYSAFSEDELNDMLVYYTDIVALIEADYTVGGVLDLEALQNSVYWWDYKSYTTWIIPNIQIAINNIDLPEEEKTEYLTSWETEWDLFGTKELSYKMEAYQEQMKLTSSYANAWEILSDSEKSGQDEITYTAFHDAYIEAQNNYSGAKSKYDELMVSVNLYNEAMDVAQTNMTNLVNTVSKENELYGFTEDDFKVLNELYIDTDYTNENFIVTDINTASDRVDRELELLNEAKNELSIESQPQYAFESDMESLFALEEFKAWHKSFNNGNFIRLVVDENTNEVRKLRIINRQFNPYLYDDTITVEFSNVTTYRGKSNDFLSLLNSSVASSKNSINNSTSASSGDSNGLSSELVRYILESKLAQQKMSSVALESYVSANQSTARAINRNMIELENGIASIVESCVNNSMATYEYGDYSLELTPDNGNTYTTTTQTLKFWVKLYKRGVDITNEMNPRSFRWYKKSSNSASDELFNTSSDKWGTSITIPTSDIQTETLLYCKCMVSEPQPWTSESGSTIENDNGTSIELEVSIVKLFASIPVSESFVEYKSIIMQLDDRILLQVDASTGSLAYIDMSTGETTSNIKISADNISLEGLTTINNGFKVNEDGSIETKDITSIASDQYATYKQIIDSNGYVIIGMYGEEDTEQTLLRTMLWNSANTTNELAIYIPKMIFGKIGFPDGYIAPVDGGMYNSGHFESNGNIKSNSSIQALGHIATNTGIEVYGGNNTNLMPYIDFHMGESIGDNRYDYMGRIIQSSPSIMGFQVLNSSNNTVHGVALEDYVVNETTTIPVWRPYINGGAYIGLNSCKWNTGFFTNTITQSDSKTKNQIDWMTDEQYKQFIMSLVTRMYTLKNSDSDNPRIHMGLYAQDVYKVCQKLGLNLSLCQASIINEDGSESYYNGDAIDDENLVWGLNYTELIAPTIKVVQMQQNQIELQEEQIRNQQEELNSLKQEVEELKQMIKGMVI